MTNFGIRSSSEPPENIEYDKNTGLKKSPFAIKINGSSLRSQENLNTLNCHNNGDIFGPRVGSRQGSATPTEYNEEKQVRRRSLRGTTPVKISGVQFTTNASDSEFCGPFGPVQGNNGKRCNFSQRRSICTGPISNPKSNVSNFNNVSNVSSSHNVKYVIRAQQEVTEKRKCASQSNLSTDSSLFDPSTILQSITNSGNSVSSFNSLNNVSSSNSVNNVSGTNSVNNVSGTNSVNNVGGYNSINIVNKAQQGIVEQKKSTSQLNLSTDSSLFENQPVLAFAKRARHPSKEEAKASISDMVTTLQSTANLNNENKITASEYQSKIESMCKNASENISNTYSNSTCETTTFNSEYEEKDTIIQTKNELQKKCFDEEEHYAKSMLNEAQDMMNISSYKLECAIEHMTQTLQTVKNEVTEDEEDRAGHLDAALRSMKETLKTLKTKVSEEKGSQKIDFAILNMKQMLKSLKNEVNNATLMELNREMTPFDLPPLSPVSPHKYTKYSVNEEMQKDRTNAIKVCGNVESGELKDNFETDSEYLTRSFSNIKEEYSSYCKVETKTFDNPTAKNHQNVSNPLGPEVGLLHYHAVKEERNGRMCTKYVVCSKPDLCKNITSKDSPDPESCKNITLKGSHDLEYSNCQRDESPLTRAVKETLERSKNITDGIKSQFKFWKPETRDLNLDNLSTQAENVASDSENDSMREFQINENNCCQSDGESTKEFHVEARFVLPNKSLTDANNLVNNEKIEERSDHCSLLKHLNNQTEIDDDVNGEHAENRQDVIENAHNLNHQGIEKRHQEVINKCIQELETCDSFEKESVYLTCESDTIGSFDQTTPSEANISASVTPTNQSNIAFKGESVIDSNDLEHIFVQKQKSEDRKKSDSSNDHITEIDNCISKQIETVIQFGRYFDINTEKDTQSTLTTTEKDSDSTEFETAKESETDTDAEREGSESKVFMTECLPDMEIKRIEFPKLQQKRRRNRTIDYHDLHYWEASVKDYHERKFSDTQTIPCNSTKDDLEIAIKQSDDRVELAKGGLGLILERLKNIESKLDDLKTIETSILTHDSRRYSLPGRLSTIPLEDYNQITRTPTGEDLCSNQDQEEAAVQKDDFFDGDLVGNKYEESDDEKSVEVVNDKPEPTEEEVMIDDERSSMCSTPIVEIAANPPIQDIGYDSDVTVGCDDVDMECVIDSAASEAEESEDFTTRTYKPMFELNISEICSESENDDEREERRAQRIEELAAGIAENILPSVQSRDVSFSGPMGQLQRPSLNMDMDTLSERSEEEGEERQRQSRPQRTRKKSGSARRSSSRERRENSVAKIRYCWRCHHAGHENWQCMEDIQPGGWCPRCLESTHWEDTCWVDQAKIQCPICSIPGHLPCVHQAIDFRQRKLVIDTFGWLAFKEWFQELAFRSWWNCSGFSSVPLYKIMQRNPTGDLDLGFD